MVTIAQLLRRVRQTAQLRGDFTVAQWSAVRVFAKPYLPTGSASRLRLFTAEIGKDSKASACNRESGTYFSSK